MDKYDSEKKEVALPRAASDYTPEKLPEPLLRGGSPNIDTNTADIFLKETAADMPPPAMKSEKSTATLASTADEEMQSFAHLSDEEAEILKRQIDVTESEVNVMTLFRFATTADWFLFAVGTICSITAGIALPLMTAVFGQLTGSFQKFYYGRITEQQFLDRRDGLILYFIYLAVVEFITTYGHTLAFVVAGESITGKVRAEYFAACLRQNIGFFDKLGPGEITTRITSDTNLLQDGISEKLGLTVFAVSTFVTAFVIGFIASWKLTLISFSTVIAIILVMGGGATLIVKYEKKTLEAYAQGGTIAEEVISTIRNATSFSTQEKLAQQYDRCLAEAQTWDIRARLTIAINIGAMFAIIYLNYAMTFWMGGRYILDREITVSHVLTLLMSTMIGAFSLGNMAPNIQAFTIAMSAAARIFTTIDRKSPLDSSSDAGSSLPEVEGAIEFKGITHIYPSRPNVTVLSDFNLVIPKGKMTALVGPSGSGKSTIVGLIERFYEPIRGTVELDGHDITTLNMKWLRRQISLVNQEPTLFNATIHENIWQGNVGKSVNVDAATQRADVIEAAKIANAHQFIMSLPRGYDTHVGERGFLLSGGQKQRIAIARAVISNPKILLLDEATSALDTKSEGIVQEALEVASAGRTTIAIAHRLSTIKDAHKIIVMAEGRIVEQGTHDELMQLNGTYTGLVEAQKLDEDGEKAEENAAEKLIGDGDSSRDPSSEVSKAQDVDAHLRPSKTLTLDGNLASIEANDNNKSGKDAQDPFVYSLWILVKFIGSFNRDEWHLLMIGFICSIICGCGNPTQSVFFGKEVVALALPLSRSAEIRRESRFWCWMYLMLAGVQFLSFCVQGVCFAICAGRLVRRVRGSAFRAMIRQDIGYFDVREVGALTSFLSVEATHMAGLSGVTLGTILTVSTTLISAMVVSCALGWKLGLVCAATIPVLLLCGFVRFWMLSHLEQRSRKASEKSASFACEATSAIRTVAALTREDDVLEHYKLDLAEQARKTAKSVAKSSILYATSQSMVLLCMALGFWYGGGLVASHEYSLIQFFICFSTIIFGAQSAGTIFSFAPDMGKSKAAATELKRLFDRTPVIDSWSTKGEILESVRGRVEFKGVGFAYPTRPGNTVLKGLDLVIEPGQHVAFVGASGCGKSTTIGLIERFYNPSSGKIYLDGKDITDLNLMNYRSHIALVSQEPTLYQGTIKDNILLGTSREEAEVSDAEIEAVCQGANIHDFILSLPDGISTVVGSKGTMLSGGQKQRIAIARALLRNPRILLLDEATSALDSGSEKVVQDALDSAARGRTTISIAHRLSTIQKADIIYVFEQGQIVESGTHSQLIALSGRYSELVSLQSFGPPL